MVLTHQRYQYPSTTNKITFSWIYFKGRYLGVVSGISTCFDLCFFLSPNGPGFMPHLVNFETHGLLGKSEFDTASEVCKCLS